MDEPSACTLYGDAEHAEDRPIRVLLVNEFPVLVETLDKLLSDQKKINILEASRGSELLMLPPALLPRLVDDVEPDVVLINCTRGNADWTNTIAALRDRPRPVKVAVVVMTSDPETLRPFINARADGCITADVSLAEYLRMIHRIHAGDVLFPPAVLMHLLTEGPRARPDPATNARSALGSRELEVLETLATGLSTEEVAARLGITVHTVRTHLKNVLVKLHAHSKLEAVMIGLRFGLIRFPE
jgi:two-component system NarL family response regulator